MSDLTGTVNARDIIIKAVEETAILTGAWVTNIRVEYNVAYDVNGIEKVIGVKSATMEAII
jgi:hypothetical protein